MFLTIVLFTYLFIGAQKKEKKSLKKISQILSQKQRLKVKIKKNDVLIDKLENDPDTIIRVAREKHNLGKENEFIFFNE